MRFQSPQIAGNYRSTFHALVTIVREERFLGLYKGIASPLVSSLLVALCCHIISVPSLSYFEWDVCDYQQATVGPMNGLVFASYRFFMKIQLENDQTVPTLAQIALAGAGSGIVSSFVTMSSIFKLTEIFLRRLHIGMTTPIELIKIRQQSLLTVTSARTVALQIFRESGIWGLYRGLAVTALRDCGYGAYFLTVSLAVRFQELNCLWL